MVIMGERKRGQNGILLVLIWRDLWDKSGKHYEVAPTPGY